MDKKDLVRLLNHKLEAIDTLLNSFDQSSDIHNIDIDLLLSKIRLLYDDVKLLAQLDSSSDKSDIIPASQDMIAEFPEPTITSEPSVVPEPPESTEPTITSEPSVSPEPTITHELSAVPEPPIVQNPNSNILTAVKMQPVDDIMVVIGLNDRFLFTRELFDNDAEKFTKTIYALNQKENWDQAFAYMDEHFQWNAEDPTLILFLSFVKRRYF